MAIGYDARYGQHNSALPQPAHSPVESPLDDYREHQSLPGMLDDNTGPVVFYVTFGEKLGEWYTYSRRQDENSIG